VNRPAPRIVTAIEDLARQLHPEAFSAHPEDEKEKKPLPPQRQLSLRPNDSSNLDRVLSEVCACAL
jgi:hypothetical protein